MNVVVLSRGVKVIPGPGQELYADTREAGTSGGREDAYLYFGQAGEFTGKNASWTVLWWTARRLSIFAASVQPIFAASGQIYG
jgi:hypothetical protein